MSIEDKYSDFVGFQHRKKYAQFFTPQNVADLMSAWILCNTKNSLRILDPACGLGVFANSIDSLAEKSIEILGYDIDKKILEFGEKCMSRLSKVKYRTYNADYMFSPWKNKYDGIICNPPYFKFQDYECKDKMLAEYFKHTGEKLSGLTNIYSIFLLKSLLQLSNSGRCAYVIPFEFLNSNYGVKIKREILKSNMLRYIILFDPKLSIFKDALTTSSVFLFANDSKNEAVQFINVTDVHQLADIMKTIALYPILDEQKGKIVNTVSLDPKVKWRNYYNGYVCKYVNLTNSNRYIKATRGIATGDNSFFLFNKEKIEKTQIPMKYFLPVVTKATQVKKQVFTQKDYNALSNTNQYVYLLNVRADDLSDPYVKKYIEWGISHGVNKKYLTSHRNPWYSIEKRESADVWVSVFMRTGLKFVINQTKVKNLTTFHGITLDKTDDVLKNVIMAYLLSPIAIEMFSANKRQYGGGLEKYEPNDITKSLCVDFRKMGDRSLHDISELYKQYIVCATDDITKKDEIIDRINALFVSFINTKQEHNINILTL